MSRLQNSGGRQPHTNNALTALGCILALYSGWASAQQLYRITNIGTLGGRFAFVDAINASGQVTGTSSIADGEPSHAFLWTGGVMQDLGNLGGSIFSVAAINDAGQVTGSVRFASSGRVHAFLWDGSTMRDLGTLGGDFGAGEDINAAGQVTGTSNLVSGALDYRAFLWDGNEMRALGTLGGTRSFGEAINALGQVTGSATTAAGNNRAFLWDGTTMRGLGTLGGKNSFGHAVNNAGQVAGRSETTSGQTHAFLWDGSKMKDLGILGGEFSNFSAALAINASGQVMGEADNALGQIHAFLWNGTAMRDLGTIATGRANPQAMNSSGQVVGWVSRDCCSDIPFISSNGAPMQKLNNLIDPSDPLKSCVQLSEAMDINDRGQIAAHGINKCTEPLTSPAFLLTPLEYSVAFTAPAASSRWKRGATVHVKVALVNAKGARITDSRATTLANTCQLKVSATGAQTKAATCMKYNATTNEFYFDWKLGTSGTGSTALNVAATYKFSMPETITTSKSRTISIIQ